MSRTSLKVGGAFLLSVVASSAMAAETITYEYDALGRLKRVTHAGTINDGMSSSYTYDNANNRTNITVSGAAPQDVIVVVPLNGYTVIKVQ